MAKWAVVQRIPAAGGSSSVNAVLDAAGVLCSKRKLSRDIGENAGTWLNNSKTAAATVGEDGAVGKVRESSESVEAARAISIMGEHLAVGVIDTPGRSSIGREQNVLQAFGSKNSFSNNVLEAPSVSLSEGTVVVQDGIAVGVCSLGSLVLVLYQGAGVGKSSSLCSMFLRSALQDCRELLFALLGPKVTVWVQNPRKVSGVLTPLLKDPVRCILSTSDAQSRMLCLNRWFRASSNVNGTCSAPFALFALPNLCRSHSLEQENMRDRIEETLDLLDSNVQRGNDTFDEADLCLSVGIALIVDGLVIYSTLNQHDISDVFRALAVWQHNRPPGNMDGSDLFVTATALHACVSKITGTRLPLAQYARSINPHKLEPWLKLEKRVAAVVVKDGVAMVRLLVSQHPDPHGTGHLDPYGLLPMERALQNMLFHGVITQFRGPLSVGHQISAKLEIYLNEARQEVCKPAERALRARSNSEGAKSERSDAEAGATSAGDHKRAGRSDKMWSRLKGSFRRHRSRSLSHSTNGTPVDNEEPSGVGGGKLRFSKIVAAAEAAAHSPETAAVWSLCNSAWAVQMFLSLGNSDSELFTTSFENVQPTAQSNQHPSLLPDRLAANPHSLGSLVWQTSGISLQDLEERFGF